MKEVLNQLYPIITGKSLRDILTKEPLRDLLKQCRPIVEREALGTRGKKEIWDLLAAIDEEIN